MKPDFHFKIHKRMTRQDRLYGTTTMGARGQVVIPAQARKDLNLKPGDQLLVMGKFGKTLALIKTDELESFMSTIINNLAGTGLEKQVSGHISRLFGKMLPKVKR